MSNWITDRANEIRRAEQERKTERDRQITTANELKAKTKPFWNDLLGLLQESVREFNVAFPEPERQIDKFDLVSNGVVMRRSTYPSVTVKASLNNQETAVQYSISRTHRKGTDAVEKQSTFSYAIVNGQAGYVNDGLSAHEDVARLFLEPFFEF